MLAATLPHPPPPLQWGRTAWSTATSRRGCWPCVPPSTPHPTQFRCRHHHQSPHRPKKNPIPVPPPPLPAGEIISPRRRNSFPCSVMLHDGLVMEGFRAGTRGFSPGREGSSPETRSFRAGREGFRAETLCSSRGTLQDATETAPSRRLRRAHTPLVGGGERIPSPNVRHEARPSRAATCHHHRARRPMVVPETKGRVQRYGVT